MANETPAFHFDGQQLTRCCKEAVPGADDQALIRRMQEAYPDFPIQLVRTGHPWYRLGGVVDRQGNRVAHDLVEWSDRAYLECGQNFQTLLAHCLEQRLIATRHKGVTLYISARTGPRAEDFVQIEVDRSQEVADRYVVDPDAPPADLEELIDPIAPAPITSYAVAAPRYIYRRKTEVAMFLQALAEHRAEPHPAQRFIQDWNRSSAGGSARAFSQEWTLKLYQHKGRHGERIMNVDLVGARENWPAHLDQVRARGKALATLLSRFDADAGYPFAWFFAMVKGKGVSPHVGEAVAQDLQKDFGYLPKRDALVLADWIAAPYCA